MAAAFCAMTLSTRAEERDLVDWDDINLTSMLGPNSYLQMSLQEGVPDEWGVKPSAGHYNTARSQCRADGPAVYRWDDRVGSFHADTSVRTGGGFVSLYAERVATEQCVDLDLRGLDPDEYGRMCLEWYAHLYRGAHSYTNVRCGMEDFSRILMAGETHRLAATIAPDIWMDWGEWYTWMQRVKRMGKSMTGPIGYEYDWHAPRLDGRELLRPGGPTKRVNPEPEKANTREPINTIDGCMNFSQTDIVIPAPGIPLILKRTYISTLNEEGALGPRWTPSYRWELTATNQTFKGTSYSWMGLRSGHGPAYWFEERNGGYESPLGRNWRLTEETNGGHVVTMPPDVRLSFDSNGVLRTAGDYWANKLTYEYSNSFPNHLLTRIDHSAGQSLEFGYSGGLMVSATAATNLGMRYTYNQRGELVRSVRTASGRAYTNSYLYDAAPGHHNHSLTQRINSAGDVFRYTYATNAAGQTTSKAIHMVLGTNQYEHTVGYGQDRTRVAYKGQGKDRLLEYVYDPELHWVDHIAVVSEGEAATNEHGQLTGITTTYSSSGGQGGNGTSGSVRFLSDESGVYFCHDQRGNTECVQVYDKKVGQWLVTRRTFDDRNNVVSEGFGYCTEVSGGSLVVRTVPYHGPTQTPPTRLVPGVEPFAYSVPTGVWSYAWHSEYEVPTRSTDPEGNRTEYEYTNALVSRVKQFYAESESYDTAFVYAGGLLTAVTNANGHWARYEYDALGRPSAVIPQAGPAARMEHNALGHLWKLTVPGMPGGDPERSTTFDTDALGRVARIIYPDGKDERFFYDTLGNVTGRVDRAGRMTSMSFAPTRKLTGVGRAFPSAPGGEARTRLDWDNQFNSLRVWDAMGRCVELYELDEQERPVTVYNVESQAMHTTYGVADYVDKVKRFDGSEVAFAYDTPGRLASAAFPAATNSFTYYRNGLLQTASNRLGKITNTYDRLNQLTRTIGGTPQSRVDYHYLPAGQVASAGSVGGQTRYAYDAGERMTGIESAEGGFIYTYHPHNGLVAGCSSTNSGLIVSYEYDILDRVTGITWSNAAGVVRSFDYTYDDVGMITRIEREDGTANGYGYDALDRLTSEERFDAAGKRVSASAYTYDLSGNRLTCTRDATVTTYSYPHSAEGNRLAGWSTAERQFADEPPTLFVFGSAELPPAPVPQRLPSPPPAAPLPGTSGSCTYDTAGCVTGIVNAGTALALTWDSEYRVQSVSTGDQTLESYAYDALGRRIRVAADGATNYLVHSGPHVIAELDAAGTLQRSYTHGPGIDNILAMTVHTNTATNTYYFLKDHLGTVHAVTDDSGLVVESYTYDAWGNVTAHDPAGVPIPTTRIGNRYLFQGREYSWKTGLYYFRARWYNPTTGRWLSKDPIGIAGGLNQYVFCGNRPVTSGDPFGLTYYSNYISDGDHQYGFNGTAVAEFDTSGHAIGTATIEGGKALIVGAGVVSAGTGVAVGAALVAVEAAPLALSAGTAVLTSGQDAFYGLMAWQPFHVLVNDSMNVTRHVGSYVQSSHVTSIIQTPSVADMWLSAQPYFGQFAAGIPSGPGGPYQGIADVVSWGSGSVAGKLGAAVLHGTDSQKVVQSYANDK
jgi:RHS repeat-associated protein